MNSSDLGTALGPELSAALERKGYSQLTPVQQAVLDPALDGRDLRISSQTGSGKTLAIGFALRKLVLAAPTAATPVARPCAVVVAPTRELAQQSQAELQWLYADCDTQVVVIAGGASYRDEHRALARRPRLIVVGTPGRLLDHLDRGSIDLSSAAAVVLDEADRLLDMGFREELDRILAHATAEHRTHLVSATFAREVRALADRVQAKAIHVEGTRLGEANADIDHVLHVIDPREKLAAIVNLLLANPEMQTLIFLRTRADVASLTEELVKAGFAAGALSGELDQAARNRALAAFKNGRQSVLVATDVAARGIDLLGVTRVIHAEPPTSAVAYTHRAGRTGRAGRKGVSSLLITPAQAVMATRLLRAANIPHRFEPIPSAESLRKQLDQRVFEELTQGSGDPVDQRALELARRLLAAGQAETVFARLLLRSHLSGAAQPRELRQLPPNERDPRGRHPADRHPGARPPDGGAAGFARGGESARGASFARPKHSAARHPGARPAERGGAGERSATESARGAPVPRAKHPAVARHTGARPASGESFRGVAFRVSWGGRKGADPRKLLAIVCRRGQVRGTDVGAIRIEADHSIVEIAHAAADSFATHAARPDPRDRDVQIRPDRPAAAAAAGRKSLKRRK
jgi:ATP-dependent RNA helicase DeaD